MVVKYTKNGAPYRTPPYSAVEREQMRKGLMPLPVREISGLAQPCADVPLGSPASLQASRNQLVKPELSLIVKDGRYRFPSHGGNPMCNLYSVTTNQAAIVALFRAISRYVGNLPPMPGVFR